MRVAILSDIHGNLVALEAVLAALEREPVDQVVSLGDVAVTGPQPREALQRLQAVGALTVMGNTDEWLLDPHEHATSSEDERRLLEIELWSARQLTPADRDLVRAFQPTLEIPLRAGATLLCCHGSPRSNTEGLHAALPDAALAEALAGRHATVVAGGHTHTPLVRRHQDMLVLNPGSVGLPVDFPAPGRVRNPPWAEYAVIESTRHALQVTLCRVPVDVKELRRIAHVSGMPHAEWYLKDWVTG